LVWENAAGDGILRSQQKEALPKQLRRKKMTNKLKLTLLGLALMIAGSSLVPVAKADEWNKETIVTFSEPVQVPGKVLQAGTYVFKLADSDSDRDIVQVFTKDQKQLLTTARWCQYAGQNGDQPGGTAGRRSGDRKELVLSRRQLRFRVRLS